MKIPKKDSCEIRLAGLARVRKNVEKYKKIIKHMKIPKKDSCETRLAGLARVRENVEKHKKNIKNKKIPKKDSCKSRLKSRLAHNKLMHSINGNRAQELP